MDPTSATPSSPQPIQTPSQANQSPNNLMAAQSIPPASLPDYQNPSLPENNSIATVNPPAPLSVSEGMVGHIAQSQPADASPINPQFMPSSPNPILANEPAVPVNPNPPIQPAQVAPVVSAVAPLPSPNQITNPNKETAQQSAVTLTQPIQAQPATSTNPVAASLPQTTPLMANPVTPVAAPIAAPVAIPKDGRKSSLAIAGLIIGVMAILVEIFISSSSLKMIIVTVPLSLVAIGLSAPALGTSRRGMAIAGLVLGSLSLVSILILYGVSFAIDNRCKSDANFASSNQQCQNLQTNTQNQSQSDVQGFQQ